MPGQPLYRPRPTNGSGSPPPPLPATTPVPAAPPPQDHDRWSMSPESIVALSIAGAIVAGGILLFIIHSLKKRRRVASTQRASDSSSPPAPDSSSPPATPSLQPRSQASSPPAPDSTSAPALSLPPRTEASSSQVIVQVDSTGVGVQAPVTSATGGALIEEVKKDEPCARTNEGDQRPEGTQDLQEVKEDEPFTTANEGDQHPEGTQDLQIIRNCDLEELRELGSGTFGTVYLGKWRGTTVAIKRIHSHLVGDASEHSSKRDEFWNEVRKLASLHHPNVVAFYGVVLDGPGGSIATVTEYVADGSLRRALQANMEMFDKRRRLIVAMDIAICMEYLHEKKIVHFDLKSDNLLLNLRDPQQPICKVCDLGISKAKCQTLVSGGMRGTLPWMAPELLDASPVSEKVDVYSFGIVMWELLTGEEPYKDLHYGTVLGGIANNNLRPDVPDTCEPWWRTLMEECWSSKPSDRPSFTEIATRLRAAASSPAGVGLQ